ncbi:hypothetical protein OKW43_007536 [Paraburkholderia sp. WC7.3g]|uniref:hypothetical protein n=1 Tax=Paraburkholderia sp. WC7.3g TaxID=2991070 RepID=UPI003D1CAB65
MNRNTRMDFDAADRELFVAGRDLGKFYPIENVADHLIWDGASGRVFKSGDEGIIVYKRQPDGTFIKVTDFSSSGSKRSLYMSSQQKLYARMPCALVL